MDYEKKYKEALERAKKANKCEDDDREPSTSICEYIFPELAGSGDERIKKEIITFIATTPKQRNSHTKWIAWLEKQGEQKPAWSEVDDYMLESIISDFAAGHKSSIGQDKWLKSLKERVQPQNTWKPSDEQMELLKDASARYEGLQSLYNDLNKLKGE